MNINSVYTTESKYLRAEALPQNVRVPVVIEGYEMTTFEDGKKQICLRFENKDKLLGLNKTNATTIAGLIGSHEVEDWTGYKIKLYRTKVQFQDKMVDAIRVDDGFCENPHGESTIKSVDASEISF